MASNVGDDLSPLPDAEDDEDDDIYDSNAEPAPMTPPTIDIATPTPVRNAAKALFAALGTPKVDNCWTGDEEAGRGCHPFFALAAHCRGHDSGTRDYTAKPCRGEDGDVLVLDISSQKVAPVLTRVNYPNGSGEIHKALLAFLGSCETR